MPETLTAMRCEECKTLTRSPISHEHDFHGGAQTCWPHADDHDLFLNALGALLASTMRDELDEDGAEEHS